MKVLIIGGRSEHYEAALSEDFKLVVASTDKIYAAFFSW